MPSSEARTSAEWIVDFLKARAVECIYGLQGGHVQPIRDQLDRRGVRIVDARDKRRGSPTRQGTRLGTRPSGAHRVGRGGACPAPLNMQQSEERAG